MVDGGRFPAKRIAGEPVRIEAHCFTDGHDTAAGRVALASRRQARSPTKSDMAGTGNDVWTAEFTPPVPGRYRYDGLGVGGSFRILAQASSSGARTSGRHSQGGPASRAGPRDRGRRSRRRRRDAAFSPSGPALLRETAGR
jgi:hypothetical protein